MKITKPFFYSLSLLVITACGGGSVDSSDLKTEGIHATIRISGYDDTTHVDCRLTAGGPNGSDIELSSGDELTARAYGETKVLEREPQLFGAYDSYLADFDSNIAGETLFIRLVRANDPDATNTYITIPAKVTITSPANREDNYAAIDDDVTVVWDQNFQGDANIYTHLSCTINATTDSKYTNSRSTTISDTGEYTVNFYSMVDADSRDNIDASVNCEGLIRVEREVEGVLDSNFDGGNIKMTQSDMVQFDLDY